MSIPTLAPRPAAGGAPLDPAARAAGIADAQDEQHAGAPLNVLQTRLDAMTAHLHEVGDAYLSYVLGYSHHVAALMARQQATRAAAATRIRIQISAAFEDQENHR